MIEHNVICIDKALQFHTEHLVLNSLLTMLPVNFLWCNETGQVIGCNESYMKFFEHHELINDLIGLNLRDFGGKSAWMNTQKVLETGQSLLIEESHLTKNGERVHFLSMKSPLIKNNKIVGAVIIAVDITDRKRLEIDLINSRESLLIANESKKNFLDNVRHDLRFPFTGILGLSQLLLSNETDPIKRDSLNDIVQCSELLLTNLNDIMHFVELENGFFPDIKKEFDIPKVLQEVFVILVPVAKNKRIDFSIKIEKAFSQQVVGDEEKFKRILLNLVSNALKFTDSGYVEITGSWFQENDSKGIAQVVVSDTGIGIPSDKKDFIFGKFNRLDPSYHGKYEGKGLGLAIVKEFLSEIGGQISIESELGVGSHFKVAVPYELSLFSKIEKISSNDNAHKVLLVEDYALVSKVSKKILENNDIVRCSVDVASTGKEAIELAQSRKYELILMDIGLPDMTGYQVTKKIISSKNSINSQTPIIALTGHDEEVQNCLDAGMIDLIPKPLSEDKLELVQVHLTKKESL